MDQPMPAGDVPVPPAPRPRNGYRRLETQTPGAVGPDAPSTAGAAAGNGRARDNRVRDGGARDRARDDRAKARAARAAARAAARSVPPERKSEYAHLDLPMLRHFRRALMEEEQRVSYWRRILQAKLDTVRERDHVHPADVATLRPVLTSERMNRGRLALVSFLPSNDIPPLPDLGRLWETATPLDCPDRLAALERDLQHAEAQLSRYRRSLHHTIDLVTAELVARYREDPNACLVALPIPTRQADRARRRRKS